MSKEVLRLKEELAEIRKRYEDRKQFFISEIRSQMEIINNLLEENNKLKVQLAEKEKIVNNYGKFAGLTLREFYEKYNQDKISFAVEQLEKTKSFGISAEDNGWCVTHKDWLDIVEFINNQIKQLKEE